MPSIADVLHRQGDIVGLTFGPSADEAGVQTKYLLIKAEEGPNNLGPYNLGSASALADAGTGYSSIQDSSSREWLEPADENVLYQSFYGIAPSYIWLYRNFPPGVARGSLISTRAIGDAQAYIDGKASPFSDPSPITLFHTLKGVRPEFLGYHPYAEPSSVTVYLNFFIYTFTVEVLQAPNEAEIARAKLFTMGGRRPAPAPSWLND